MPGLAVCLPGNASHPAMQVGKSIKEVVESCEIIVAMVADPAAAKQVANEVAQYIGKGAPAFTKPADSLLRSIHMHTMQR